MRTLNQAIGEIKAHGTPKSLTCNHYRGNLNVTFHDAE